MFTLFIIKACRTQSVLCVLSDVVEYNTETLRMPSRKFWSEITSANITHVGTIFAELRISHFPDTIWEKRQISFKPLENPRENRQEPGCTVTKRAEMVGDGKVPASALNASEISEGTLTTEGDHS